MFRLEEARRAASALWRPVLTALEPHLTQTPTPLAESAAYLALDALLAACDGDELRINTELKVAWSRGKRRRALSDLTRAGRYRSARLIEPNLSLTHWSERSSDDGWLAEQIVGSAVLGVDIEPIRREVGVRAQDPVDAERRRIAEARRTHESDPLLAVRLSLIKRLNRVVSRLRPEPDISLAHAATLIGASAAIAARERDIALLESLSKVSMPLMERWVVARDALAYAVRVDDDGRTLSAELRALDPNARPVSTANARQAIARVKETGEVDGVLADLLLSARALGFEQRPHETPAQAVRRAKRDLVKANRRLG